MQGARSLGLTSVTILALSFVPALAISFGTQQLIRDSSDGFSLFLDGQLKVGDHCIIGTPKSGKIDGTVLSMGMRSICLRLKNGSQLSMPNSQVAGSVVTNHSLRSAEPLELRLSIPKLETQALADLQSRAQALLTAPQDLASASTAKGPRHRMPSVLQNAAPAHQAAESPSSVGAPRPQSRLIGALASRLVWRARLDSDRRTTPGLVAPRNPGLEATGLGPALLKLASSYVIACRFVFKRD